MTRCERFNDFIEVYLIPIKNLNIDIPLQVESSIIEEKSFTDGIETLTSFECFSLSASPLFGSPSFSVEIDISPEVKVVNKKKRGGYYNECVIKLTTDYYSAETGKELNDLKTNPYHILLFRGDGSKCFVRCIPESYKCEIEDMGEKRNISFTLVNVNGMQDVVENKF